MAVKKAVEAKRLADDKLAEAKVAADEQAAAEAKRAAEEKATVEARVAAEAKHFADVKTAAEEAKLAAEAKRLADETVAAEAKRLDDEKAVEEAKHLAATKAAADATVRKQPRTASSFRLAVVATAVEGTYQRALQGTWSGCDAPLWLKSTCKRLSRKPNWQDGMQN